MRKVWIIVLQPEWHASFITFISSFMTWLPAEETCTSVIVGKGEGRQVPTLFEIWKIFLPSYNYICPTFLLFNWGWRFWKENWLLGKWICIQYCCVASETHRCKSSISLTGRQKTLGQLRPHFSPLKFKSVLCEQRYPCRLEKINLFLKVGFLLLHCGSYIYHHWRHD